MFWIKQPKTSLEEGQLLEKISMWPQTLADAAAPRPTRTLVSAQRQDLWPFSSSLGRNSRGGV